MVLGAQMTRGQGLFKTSGDINVCKEFELIEVKVPIKILGTVGFSLRRDIRYNVSNAI